jgi:hypothetical protein
MDANPRLLGDCDFMVSVINKNPINLNFALCDIPIDVSISAIKKNPQIVSDLNETKLVEIVAKDGLMLKYINVTKRTALIIDTALMQNPAANKYI